MRPSSGPPEATRRSLDSYASICELPGVPNGIANLFASPGTRSCDSAFKWKRCQLPGPMILAYSLPSHLIARPADFGRMIDVVKHVAPHWASLGLTLGKTLGLKRDRLALQAAKNKPNKSVCPTDLDQESITAPSNFRRTMMSLVLGRPFLMYPRGDGRYRRVCV
ncbi:hypothetical protein EI94DRAFT_1722299 [Lactarius quietus]|nr:hypothetical protein EI94DRAFT_1722299 [Lactarius quietus]